MAPSNLYFSQNKQLLFYINLLNIIKWDLFLGMLD